jgi:hypothetical protein
VDAAASCTGNKFFCHLVNMERDSAPKITLAIGGKTITNFKVLEIAADPELEVMENTSTALEPVERNITDGNYTLPCAAVAVIEAEL